MARGDLCSCGGFLQPYLWQQRLQGGGQKLAWKRTSNDSNFFHGAAFCDSTFWYRIPRLRRAAAKLDFWPLSMLIWGLLAAFPLATTFTWRGPTGDPNFVHHALAKLQMIILFFFVHPAHRGDWQCMHTACSCGFASKISVEAHR